jgi:hypothetical protein
MIVIINEKMYTVLMRLLNLRMLAGDTKHEFL